MTPARETTIALTLSAVGFVCGAWLIVKAFAEITAGVALPRGAK
jgi:hypothetical protein